MSKAGLTLHSRNSINMLDHRFWHKKDNKLGPGNLFHHIESKKFVTNCISSTFLWRVMRFGICFQNSFPLWSLIFQDSQLFHDSLELSGLAFIYALIMSKNSFKFFQNEMDLFDFFSTMSESQYSC